MKNTYRSKNLCHRILKKFSPREQQRRKKRVFAEPRKPNFLINDSSVVNHADEKEFLFCSPKNL